MARYGSKLPLIVGPLIAGAGFLLFAVPSARGSYWTTFFPAFVVLGLGMAITVAPLTTVVMSSVEQDRVGTASGINNAVARVAGVLAIAVLGVVLVSAFSGHLQHSLADLNLAPNVLGEIHSNSIKLAGTPVPSNLDPGTSAAIRQAIVRSFVFGFRMVMLICAGVAAASAVVAWKMIPSEQGA